MNSVLESLNNGKQSFSIEVVPPSRGADHNDVLVSVDAIMAWNPAFVSVTDHPSGRVWTEYNGQPVQVSVRNKPGTLGLCYALRNECGIWVVPHVVCVGNNTFRVEDELIDLRYAGFSDVFVIRGDERFVPAAVGSAPAVSGAAQSSSACNDRLCCAADLVQLVMNMNRGDYAGGKIQGIPAGFSVGVAGYPQKHPAAVNPDYDMAELKRKVDAGAVWIITQMVFDAAVYRDFVARARAAGIQVPIVPGIKPITRKKSLHAVPGSFFVDVPQSFAAAMDDARSPAEERLVGIKHAAALASALYDAGAPCVHIFTMGKARDTVETLSALFGPAGAEGI